MKQYSDATYAYLLAMLGVLANQLQKAKNGQLSNTIYMCIYYTFWK